MRRGADQCRNPVRHVDADADRPAKETARDHVIAAPLIGLVDESAATSLARLPTSDPAGTGVVWVVDAMGRLAGTVPLAGLVLADRNAPLQSLMRPPPPTVLPDTDQEIVATVACAARTSVVPVADKAGRFLGIVPPLAIIDVLHREHDEDVRRLVGITEWAGTATSALTVSPRRRVASRLPWLLVGLCGCFVSAVVMAGFEHRLAETIAVAFFVPAIVYLADAIGTQTEAVAVRGLSLEHLPLTTILVGELATGALLGLLLGALAFPVIASIFGVRLAAAVFLSILAAGALASVIGLFLPWLLSRVGYDPAYGSGPIATIVQDVLSLIVYFAAVSLLL